MCSQDVQVLGGVAPAYVVRWLQDAQQHHQSHYHYNNNKSNNNNNNRASGRHSRQHQQALGYNLCAKPYNIGCDTGCKPHTLPGIQIPVIYFWYLIYPHIPSHIPRIPSMLPFLLPKSPWKSGYSAAGLGHTRRAMSKMLRQGWTSAQFVEIFWVKPSKNGDLTIQNGDVWLICGD